MKTILLKLKLLLVVVFSSSVIFAANQLPLSTGLLLQPLLPAAKLELPALDRQRLLDEAKMKSSTIGNKIVLRPLQIAQTNVVNKSIQQFGQWQTIQGESVWRLQISAKDALHLNLGFRKFHLPQSAVLFILDGRTGGVLEHYTALDNKFHGELWTALLKTNKIALEINLSASERDLLKFELVQIGQGFKAIEAMEYDTKSGSCNIDVVCPEGDDWRNEIRSVARYTISDGSGTYLCTGTLLNNTNQDLEPLFITAAHCLVSETTAPSMVFYWNYQTSVCNGTPDGAMLEEQTGASLVSRWDDLSTGSDFALVRLDDSPSINFDVYYSGW
ncbi:MAG: hypothetical protein DRQ47_09220, partial [Gammaproteobacteria bacterium]